MKGVLTPRQVSSIRRRIEKHKTAIAAHRDALRDLIEDVETICDDATEAVELLETAADTISRML